MMSLVHVHALNCMLLQHSLTSMNAWIKWGRSRTGHAARACMSTETTCKTTKATVIYLYYVFCSCSWANDLRANHCWSGTWTIQIWQVAHARNYIIMSCNILNENSAHDIIVNLTSNNTSYEMFVQTTCVKSTSTGLIFVILLKKKKKKISSIYMQWFSCHAIIITLVPVCPDSRSQCTSSFRGSGLSSSTSSPLRLNRSLLDTG